MERKIFQKLAEECKLFGEAEVIEYVTKREKEILAQHLENRRITAPGERGGHPKYWMTKMQPSDKNHQHPLYGKTKEELEMKIISYVLGIENERSFTVRNALEKAVDPSTKTGKRSMQRFDKWFGAIAKKPLKRLSERDVREALDAMVFGEKKVSLKEFNESVSSLNRIADYCAYEHISVIDLKEILSLYRKVKLAGKHIFRPTKKQTKDLAFSLSEAQKIVVYALKNPSYKALSVALLITTGLRVGEALALTLDSVFMREGYLWIDKIEDTTSRKILPYVKENKSREVYLSEEAYAVLRAIFSLRATEKTDSPYLLLNSFSADGKMHLRAIDDFMRTTLHREILGYGDEREARSPHDCRRTYASLSYLNGTEIFALSCQLGHSTIAQTEAYIKDIREAHERKNAITGCGILTEKPSKINVYDDYTTVQKKKRAGNL